MNARLLRALVAFLVMPGIVAFVVPWCLRSPAASLHPFGAAPWVLGVGALLWCVRDFYVTGRGTLAPWSPPTTLVTVGLYRFSRNPMYVSVVLILVGWAALYASRTLWIYAAFVALAFHARVVFGEEPWLARTHGAAWTAYRAAVRRWL